MTPVASVHATVPATVPATDVVEQALQRLRILGAATVLLVVLARRSAEDGPAPSVLLGGFVAVGLVGLGLLARWGGHRGWPRAHGAVVLQIAADAVLVAGGLWATAAPLGSSASLLLLVPVLEAAVRFRVLGAVACWGGCVALLAARELLAWYPGDPLPVAALAEVATVLLVVTLPAAYLAEHLAAQLRVAEGARVVAERRVELLVDLAAASRDLNAPSVDAVVAATIRSVEALTGRSVRSVRLDDVASQTGVLMEAGGEGGAAVTVRGDRVGFVVETGVDADEQELVVEALEVLAAQAQVTLRNAELHGQLRASVSELSHRAHHDALTGLANRSHLVATARRHLAAGDEVGLLFVDLDRFKPINDRYGHEAGDRVLVEVARRLTVAAGEGAMPARLGGDEFAVLVPHGGDPSTLAARVLRSLSAPIDLDDGTVTVGASIGTAVSAGDGRDIDELLRAADARMYEVKEARGSGAVRTRR